MPDFKTSATKAMIGAARLSGAARLARRLTSPFGAVFTLHHVSPEPWEAFEPTGHLSVHPDFLDRVLANLTRRGIEIVTVAEAVSRIGKADRSGFFVAFTLDDGFRDNLEYAAPVFRKYGAPYTLFVVPGFCDGTVLPWWETIGTLVRRSSAVRFPDEDGAVVPCANFSAKRRLFDRLIRTYSEHTRQSDIDGQVRRLAQANDMSPEQDERSAVMTWADVRAIAQDPLCSIGAHTMTHPMLSRLDPDEALWQMRESRAQIAAQLSREPEFFAYPYGSIDACGPREFELARRAGFTASFTTRLHALTRERTGEIQALPRLSLNGYYQNVAYLDVFLSGLPGLWKHRRR